MHPLRLKIPELIFASISALLVGAAFALAWIPDRSAAAEPALSLPAPSAAPPSDARPVAAWIEPEAPPPRRVTIDRLGIDSTLAPLDVQADGTLEVPADYAQAGWHRSGTRPGNTGPAVLVGHVDSTEGPAVFFRLRELAPGDRLSVARVDGSQVIFEVYAVERYAKANFPTDAVYGATTVPELRLLTCGGSFDERSRSYEDNVVVYARVAAPVTPESSS